MIYICTTAINRPDLHKFVFETNKNFLKSMFEICWVINIDCVDKLKATFDETKDNYINCINSLEQTKKKIVILEKSENPSFTRAVKKLCDYCNTCMKPSDILFWLEDDWIIKNNTFDINHFAKKMNDNIAFHLYQKCKIENLYPMLRGYKLAKLLFKIAEKIPYETKDPEVSIKGRYPRVQYDIYLIKENINEQVVSEMMMNTLEFNIKRGSTINNILESDILPYNNKETMYAYNKIIFDDIGREYMKNLNIIKNTKQNENFYKEIK